MMRFEPRPWPTACFSAFICVAVFCRFLMLRCPYQPGCDNCPSSARILQGNEPTPSPFRACAAKKPTAALPSEASRTVPLYRLMNSLLILYASASGASPNLRRACALSERSTVASHICHGLKSSESTNQKSCVHRRDGKVSRSDGPAA